MTVVVWIALVSSFLVLAAVGARAGAARRASLLRLAHAFGLEYAATDVFDDRWEPFRLFGMGQARGIENVVYGRVEGAEVRAFDYWYRRGTDRGRTELLFGDGAPGFGAWMGLTKRFSCAVAGLPASCPSLVVSPRGVRERLAELVAPAVPLESEEFTRRFDVRCDDARFAVAFLEPRVMEALLAVARPPTLAISEDRMLLVTRRLRPAAVLGLLHEAGALAQSVPRVLASLYPLRLGFRPQDAVSKRRT